MTQITHAQYKTLSDNDMVLVTLTDSYRRDTAGDRDVAHFAATALIDSGDTVLDLFRTPPTPVLVPSGRYSPPEIGALSGMMSFGNYKKLAAVIPTSLRDRHQKIYTTFMVSMGRHYQS